MKSRASMFIHNSNSSGHLATYGGSPGFPVMSHPEFLRSPSNIFLQGLQGVWGCAQFLSFLAPPEAAQKGKKRFRVQFARSRRTPIPDRGRLPSALPLLKRQYEHFRFQKNSG